jgi:hypothetical protein
VPFTSAQLDALTEAIASGVLIVKYQDRTVEYQSLRDMLKLKVEMEKELGLTTETVRRSRAGFSRA